MSGKGTNLPTVSVIVPTHNAECTLQALLDSLVLQTYRKELTEIIIVDNNSTDASVDIASKFNTVTILHETQIQNAGAARNTGIKAASGEIIAFTDADCLPRTDWLEKGVESIINLKTDRIAGAVCFAPLSRDSSAFEMLDALYNLNQEKVVELFSAAVTANLFVKSELFSKVGLFPTNYFEDMQWNRRASNAGFSLNYNPDVVVCHPPRNSWAAIFEKGCRSGKGVFALCDMENRGGFLGYRHLLRMIRMLFLPRFLYWERLPFDARELPWHIHFKIQGLKWLGLNFAETLGYGQWLLKRYLKA
jgi:glycosyltransferase involved in cell wall biosynthesis